jgi:formylglycine-generating enzyme required for sulfatase activity
MNGRLQVLAVGVLLVLAVAAACFAQGDKPWERPGTKAGEEITGPDGGKMVWVPPGEFMMGSGDDDKDAENWEKPAHRVQITKGFWLGKCDVTLGQWRAYCKQVGLEKSEATAPGDNYPVVQVSCDAAMAYCRNYGLKLPTEAQWEYAARGPEGRKYPWGNVWDEGKCCNGANPGPGGSTYPVGRFPEGASWCGALDMAGEVWQWCKDWSAPNYYQNAPGADPAGPERGQYRILRGGSWGDGPKVCRSADRFWGWPRSGGAYGGFRVASTP